MFWIVVVNHACVGEIGVNFLDIAYFDQVAHT